MAVTGTITAIENGTDGYTATIKDAEGKEYDATISIVNLNKSGSEYKAYNIGDTITVKDKVICISGSNGGNAT